PTDVLSFVQLYVAPGIVPVKFHNAVDSPLQRSWLNAAYICAVWLTVMSNAFDGPLQPFASGVTVIVAVTGTLPGFNAVKPPISPLPLPANPILVLLFVQLY